MISDRQKSARYHSDFYRDNYHKILRALLIMCFIMLLAIAGIIYLIIFNPTPPYYASSTQGQIIPLSQAS